jgi:predicted Zn-dependent protease
MQPPTRPRCPAPARRTAPAAAGLAALLLCAACATNPATGERQLSLVGEQQEIALGREAAGQVAGQIGLYPDEKVQRYVARVGNELAARSERPDLPWSFQVVDDPSVNAFALPGGFIYVTRGIMTYLDNEAELASVLGHEIGHVTARHSVERMSKAQLASLGLGIGAILSPDLRNYGDLAQTGLSLLFLKFSRDDERQADDLGVRYMLRESYDPRQMPQVFDLLGRVSQSSGGGKVPGWLSTHPEPGNRSERISGLVAQLGNQADATKIAREPYLRTIDGMVFGDDPREGYFDGNAFYHPGLAFQLRFPQGWQTSNQKQAVAAMSPGKDAMVVLTLSSAGNPAAAERAFFSQQGVTDQGSWNVGVRGLSSEGRLFSVPRQNAEELVGAAAFVELGGKVYQLLGYTVSSRWQGYSRDIESALESFDRVTDRRVLEVEPKRVDVVRLPQAMTLEEFARRYPSTVDAQTLALINKLDGDGRFPAGAEVKRVVGGRLP